MITQTITKEQILERHAKVRIFDNLYTGNEIVSCQTVLPAMEEYAQQQLSAERERAGKMVEALKVIAEKVGYIWVREDILKLIENYNAHEINS